ncbi:nucleoporin NDC1 [Tenebrio molitor]|jgi:nucleoporin NDC1|uniref:nucleoporin NDC1 n=1 Tax=Tenebrio molitor TaxID=7067 RepID=UPI0036247C65
MMQSPAINPNLTSVQTFSYKDILVKKLVRAVACSVVSQIIILLCYIILANISIFHPIEWMTSIFHTFTYLSTWIFVIIFSFIIFAQCLICGKDYVLMTSYSSTRFQQFFRVLSLHNFTLLLLHVVIGGAFVWQILSIIDSSNHSLTTTCKLNRSCLVEDTFFLILSGFWTGLYFFVKVYISTKQLVFPVIQQRKFLQLRSKISVLFKESLTLSIWPTIYFALFYYIWGTQLENRFMFIVNLDRASRESSILIYMYSWWFSTLYCFSMNLMRFFFYLFLTETVQFPIVKENEYILTLQEGIVMNNLPIVQNLACLDLFMLSQWSPLRKQLFFTLSQPGGHPHNWNNLIESVVKLFTEYTDLLKKSTETTLPQDKAMKQNDIIKPFAPITLQSPTSPSVKYRNLRNMSCHSDYLNVVDVSHDVATNTVEDFKRSINGTIDKTTSFLKIFFGINFLFGELPQVNIQKCLGNGQLIIWASQGISELAAASLTEDKYGIVQKDLPLIITTLVQLKQNLDKLNKVPSLSKKVAALDDFNYKMKNAVAAAVKHSLFNMCLIFGDYFKDFPLSKDVLQYLHVNIMLKNCN